MSRDPEQQRRFVTEITRRHSAAPHAIPCPEDDSDIRTLTRRAVMSLHAVRPIDRDMVCTLRACMDAIDRSEVLAVRHPRSAAELRCSALIIAIDMGRRMHAFGARLDVARRGGMERVVDLLSSEFDDLDRVACALVAPRPPNMTAAETLWPVMFGLTRVQVLVCVALYELCGAGRGELPMVDALDGHIIDTSFARLCAILQ